MRVEEDREEAKQKFTLHGVDFLTPDASGKTPNVMESLAGLL